MPIDKTTDIVVLVRGLLSEMTIEPVGARDLISIAVLDALNARRTYTGDVHVKTGDLRKEANDPVLEVEVWILLPRHFHADYFDEEEFERTIRSMAGKLMADDAPVRVYLGRVPSS